MYYTSDDTNIHCIVGLNIKVPTKWKRFILLYSRMVSFNNEPILIIITYGYTPNRKVYIERK
jgi:hypothetical protein